MRRLAALALLFTGLALADVAVPPLTARVTDLTGTLTEAQRSALDSRLAAFEAQKGSQIAVLMVPTTAPEAIEQYSIRVAEAWKLGRKGVDDGVLFLVAKDDRHLRLEVGYGLEGVLPDAIANRIIQDTVVPYLRSGDYYGGINAGVERVIAVVNGELLPEPQRAHRDGGGGVGQLLPIAIVFVFWFGAALKRILGQLPGSLVTGSIVGVVAWLLSSALAVAVLAGFGAFVFALLMGAAAGGRWSSGGPWVGRGGFGGGGFGGGGFGGGGGGFGGGGASGRW